MTKEKTKIKTLYVRLFSRPCGVGRECACVYRSLPFLFDYSSSVLLLSPLSPSPSPSFVFRHRAEKPLGLSVLAVELYFRLLITLTDSL